MIKVLSSKTHPYKLFQNSSTRYAEEYEALQCDIKTILDSPRGQMLGKPEFGSYLHESLGDMNDTSLCQKVQFEVERAIKNVYSHVDIKVKAETEDNKVIVKIHLVLDEYSEALDFIYEYERS